MLLGDRAHELGAIAEVVLECGRVAGAGGAHDLAQADRLDSVRREQLLGRGDQPFPGVGHARHSQNRNNCIDS